MASSSAFAAGFDSSAFSVAVRETMKMGMPENEDERLIWQFAPPIEGVPVSPSGEPYGWGQDPDADPTELSRVTPIDSISVEYALEFVDRASSSTTVLEGSLDRPTATVTLLTDAYDLIKDADYATIGTTTYQILFEAPVVAMFDVDIHTIYLRALDEA